MAVTCRNDFDQANPGTVVVLNSGGPKMTVGNPTIGDRVMCYWFDGDVIKDVNIECAALKLAPEVPKD